MWVQAEDFSKLQASLVPGTAEFETPWAFHMEMLDLWLRGAA